MKTQTPITVESFTRTIKDKFGDKVITNKVTQISIDNEDVELKCKRHGTFWANPIEYINDNRCCPLCDPMGINLGDRWSTERKKDTFLMLSRIAWGERYDYSEMEYIDNNTPVIIGCPRHGSIKVYPPYHIKHGCSKCAREERIAKNVLSSKGMSSGERKVCKLLIKMGIPFKKEYLFDKQPWVYRYDFFLPYHNIVIEYHGLQHYKVVGPYIKTEAQLKAIQARDLIKKKYATKEEGAEYIEVNRYNVGSLEDMLTRAILSRSKRRLLLR